MHTDTIETTTNLEPFETAGQSPGGVPSGLPARLIGAVPALDYLEENPGPLNPRNFENIQPLAAMAKTLDEFVKRYGRVPTTKEYDDLFTDAVAAITGVEIVKTAYRGLLDRVTEYAVEWGDEDFSESERRVILDRLNRDTAQSRLRQVVI